MKRKLRLDENGKIVEHYIPQRSYDAGLVASRAAHSDFLPPGARVRITNAIEYE